MALDQKLGTLIRMHKEAFRELGACREPSLYDGMRTVWSVERQFKGLSLPQDQCNAESPVPEHRS
jgi:hypothetical protein